MPIQHTLWTIDNPPVEVETSKLADEKRLEDMIESKLSILSDDWMLIGRQIETDTGGRVDLLAIASDASLVLIELKRNKTPRDVIAQTLDYAVWLKKLDPEDVTELYERYNSGASLSKAFQDRFERVLDDDEEPINHTHQLVVVASTLDPSSERIVTYLQGWGVPINVLTFEVFRHGNTQFLSRAWLLQPLDTMESATSGPRERLAWNNEFYACFGHDENRDWDEAVKYGNYNPKCQKAKLGKRNRIRNLPTPPDSLATLSTPFSFPPPCLIPPTADHRERSPGPLPLSPLCSTDTHSRQP